MPAPASTLDGWVRAPFTGGDLTYDCYRKGDGPGVMVIPEVPGISPEVLAFADHVVAAGFTVVLPSLFGVPGKKVTAGYAVAVIGKLCVAKEMRAFATDAERPISLFLRALAADLNATTPGPGVGVVGMCFTGGFALATAVDASVLASVLSQPSVPFPIGAARKKDLGLSPVETAAVQERTRDGLCVLGLRFSNDRALSKDRFDAYETAFGSAFEKIVLDSSKGNTGGYGQAAHSVLTAEVRTDPDNSAAEARDRVVAFLRAHVPA